MNKLGFNMCAAIHNLSLVSNAERILNNFLNDDNGDFIYICNPDGSYLKLQKGFKMFAVNGLGIVMDD